MASAAIPLAALAGVLAAIAITGLAEQLGERRARRPRRAPLALLRAVAPLGRGAPPSRSLAARLDAAGTPHDLTVADVAALKAGAGLAGALLALPAASLAPGRLGPLVVLATPAAAFLVPDALLRRCARRRARALDRELADVAELLRVAVEAGLPPLRALAEVGRRHPGVLAGELAAVAHRVGLGVPREAALDRLDRRAPTAGVGRLTAALRRAHRHGSPIGPVLAAIAADARAERARSLSEQAARAAPQIQLVVALLLVPAVLLLVAAGLAAALL